MKGKVEKENRMIDKEQGVKRNQGGRGVWSNKTHTNTNMCWSP